MFRYDRLDELIKETGKKKKYLCEKLQKCPTYLRDAKKQNTNIKGHDLIILAQELSTTPEYLSGETDEKTPASQTGNGLNESTKYLQLSPENRALVDALIDQLLKGQSGD